MSQSKIHYLPENPRTPVKVGIYSGMGAEAGNHFIEIFHNKLGKAISEGAGNDTEHPKEFIISDPWLPRKDKGVLGSGASPLDGLKKGIAQFRDFGVDFLLAPCNTLMCYKDELEKEANSQFEIVDITDETAKQAKKLLHNQPDKKRVGVLATKATIEKGLYAESLRKNGLEAVYLNEQDLSIASELIEQVKKGEFRKESIEPQMKKDISSCFEKLSAKGAEAVILGCTEFPVIFDRFTDDEKPKMPVVSSSDALAEAGVERFTNIRKERLLKQYTRSESSTSIEKATQIR